MGNQEFVNLCKRTVLDYFNNRVKKYNKLVEDIKICEDDIYIVWISKVLQNNKALVSTTVEDGMYYELTYNGDKGELYLDAYKKIENIGLKIH